ncbi:MAG: ABC transporter ATP-binding protein [Candidatus Aureabacteria bacterium]|nr:ABC transporter ATP-binding protein [Candidatus Auribacterota bacterium]
MLYIKNLNAFYDDIQALRNVSLHVKEGEIVALIGNNGAGKSTILNCISRIITSVNGSMFFRDQDMSDLKYNKAVDLGIVHVPEGRCIFPDLSVWDNLLLGSYSKREKLSTCKKNINKIFEMLPLLRKKKDQAGGTLSGGEQQILAIGRGLMAQPEIMLLDEPSMGLAPIFINDVFGILKQLKEQGKTILIVEQNAQKALEIADRAYVIETGSIILEGDTDELKTNQEIKRAYLGKGYSEIWD